MNKILITGAAGFIGFHLVQRLVKENYNVIGLDNINDYYDINLKYARLAETGIYSKKEENHCGGKNRNDQEIDFGEIIDSVIYKNYRFIRLNLEDKDELSGLFSGEKFDIVVNLAAQAGVRYSIENPDAFIKSNIVGFFNILEACRANPVKHLIFASSSSVYGSNAKMPFNENDNTDRPNSLYAATKKSNEVMAYTYCHLYKIPTTGLRFFTVYGPWGRPDMAPMLFADAIVNSKVINVYNDGDMQRDFTCVNDIVEGIYRTILLPPAYPFCIMNIGNGSPVNLIEFISLLEREFGKKSMKRFSEMQPGDVRRTWADTTLLHNYTQFKPIEQLEIGIKSFTEWYKSFYIN